MQYDFIKIVQTVQYDFGTKSEKGLIFPFCWTSNILKDFQLQGLRPLTP